MTNIMVPISPGELLDKLTILELKSKAIRAPEKLANVDTELRALTEVARKSVPNDEIVSVLRDELLEVNADLWQIEDDIRACEARKDFGAGFIALARAVYITNDRRADIKRKINIHLGSALVEEKSYSEHGLNHDS